MEPFRKLIAIAAPLPIANVDTDMILSARFLKTVSRDGLGKGLFFALRHDGQDRERPDFVLNRAPWRDAGILVALDNFGCGSSREHAPWALLDFGIRCVIAPSFADIFYGNCFKNGILPIVLPRSEVDRLMAIASEPSRAQMTVDLEAQVITAADGAFPFDIDPQRREHLLDGVDDIAVALRFEQSIAEHEQMVRTTSPWLARTGLALSG